MQKKLIIKKLLEVIDLLDDESVLAKKDDIDDLPDYGDAVKAITASNISGYFKQEIMRNLKTEGNYTYYKAVIAVLADDNLGDYARCEMIRKMQ